MRIVRGLDARLNIPYLSPRMTRLLLTLLALLTGLVAQIAPVQARIAAYARKDRGGRLGPSVKKVTGDSNTVTTGAGETLSGGTASVEETMAAALQHSAQTLHFAVGD